MVNKLGKRFFSVFLGIIALQIILPFVILCATSVIHEYREALMATDLTGKEHFVTFRIKANDPNLVVHGNEEFSFKGHWFDVKEIALHDGTYTIVALADDQETTLQQISSDQQMGGHDITHPVRKLLPFFFMYYQQHPQWALHISPANQAGYSGIFHAITLNRHYKIVIPPPNALA